MRALLASSKRRMTYGTLLCVVLGLAACGGDDDASSSDTTASTDSTAADGDDGGEILGDDEYTDVLAASFEAGDTSFGASSEEAQCAAATMVDAIGAERLQEAGLTAERLNSDEGVSGDLTDDEVSTVADSIIGCVDLPAAYARGLLGGDVGPDDVACISDRFDEAIFRELIVSDLASDGEGTVSPETAALVADAFVSCADLAGSIVESVVGEGVEVTPEQIACVESSVRDNQALRDVLAEAYATGQPADRERIGLTLIDDVMACLPDAVPSD